jgi:hypothetical protein
VAEPLRRAKTENAMGTNNVSVELFERSDICIVPPAPSRRTDAAGRTERLAADSDLGTARSKHSVIEPEAHP